MTRPAVGAPLSRYQSAANHALSLAEETGATEILVVGKGHSIVVDEEPAIFDVLLRGRMAYRFVDSTAGALFPPHPAVAIVSPKAGEAAKWYQSWPAADSGEGYALVTLDGSWPQEGLQAVPGPRLFENGIEFQGYAWQNGAAPGTSHRLWLLWQVLWQGPEDTHFFVHLLDGEDQLVGQQDTEGYPTAYRRKGDRIVSLFDIRDHNKAAGSPQWARTGLYLYPQVLNIPVIDDAGNTVTDAVMIPAGEGEPK